MTSKEYYFVNENYSKILDDQGDVVFEKISNIIKKYSKAEDYVLDVGCGAGNLLNLLKERSNKLGIDISKSSIDKARAKNINCILYNGDVIPFDDNSFDIVNSFNVIEHVSNIDLFLNESLRVLKGGGHLIVACPNFLSITNNFHWHTRGVMRKLKNVYSLILKLLKKFDGFEKMDVVVREDFQPDDDACNMMNPVDLMKWSKNNNLKIVFWSGQSKYKNVNIDKYFDKSVLRYFLGDCLLVFKKNENN